MLENDGRGEKIAALAKWVPTLTPLESLANAQEQVAEYEARKAKVRAYQRVKKEQKRSSRTEAMQA